MRMIHYRICLLLCLFLLPTITFATNAEQGQMLYNKACDLTQNDPQQAEQVFQESVQTYPTYEGYFALGRVQLKLDRFPDALDSFNKANSSGAGAADRALALAMSGQALAAMDRGREGIQVVQAAMELHPDPPEWMAAVVRAIEDDVVDKVASADEISRSLDPPRGRGISITPRINLPVRFAYDSYTLNDQGEQQVRELAKALAKDEFKGTRFLIIGHTDLQGGKGYNRTLSAKRAETTVRKLEQLQPELKGHLRPMGRGMSEPLRQGMDEKAHQLNRRVEVKVNEA